MKETQAERQPYIKRMIFGEEKPINSLRVGDVYYVGHLPWFERLWYALANHPILLAVLAAISVILLAWVLWRLLRIISRRRLNPDNE